MDLLDTATPGAGRLKVDDHYLYLTCGAIHALDGVLEELQKTNAAGAGIGLATAVVEKHKALAKMQQAQKVLRAAARAGADLGVVNVDVTLEGNAIYLNWETPAEENP